MKHQGGSQDRPSGPAGIDGAGAIALPRTITVALHRADLVEAATVLLPLDRRGLPVLLIDPVDSSGRVIQGMWLGDGAGGTIYQWTERITRISDACGGGGA